MFIYIAVTQQSFVLVGRFSLVTRLHRKTSPLKILQYCKIPFPHNKSFWRKELMSLDIESPERHVPETNINNRTFELDEDDSYDPFVEDEYIREPGIINWTKIILRVDHKTVVTD